MSAISRLLDHGGPVLFDFDGPICSIFAGSSAPEVARRLRGVLQASEGPIDPALERVDDPLEILRWAGRFATRTSLIAVEDALVTAETAAAETATPTPGAAALLNALRKHGRLVGVASNNSGRAIETYLNRERLLPAVGAIAGREPYAPELMKPEPHCLARVAAMLNAAPSDCVFIGDSLTDIQAARSIGMPVIGYAPTPTKRHVLASADAIVSTMDDLVSSAHE